MTFKELFDTLEQSSINGLKNQEIHIPMDIYFKLKKEYIEKTDSPDEERFIYSTEYFRQKSENHMQKLKELHRYKDIEKQEQVPQQQNVFILTEKEISKTIALYLEGCSFSEIIQSLKQPKKD